MTSRARSTTSGCSNNTPRASGRAARIREESALATTDVDEMHGIGEVVSAEDRQGFLFGVGGHAPIECEGGLGVALQMLEKGPPVDTIERREPRHDAVQGSAIDIPDPRVAVQERQIAKRPRGVAL